MIRRHEFVTIRKINPVHARILVGRTTHHHVNFLRTRFADHLHDLDRCCSAHKAVVLAHSGEFNSLPADMVKLANDYPEMSLILAHLGNGEGDPSRQVRPYRDPGTAMSTPTRQAV